jgi:ribonuclease-3
LLIGNKLRSYFSSDRALHQSIRNVFGFYPGNISLFKLALRHKSASKKTINGLKVNNERLEYLGDAILSAVVADYLFRKFPYKSEGFLTEMRSKIVSRVSLNKLAHKLGLTKLISIGGEHQQKGKSAGGDAFEAVVGAIYLDKGYEFTYKIIVKRIINIHFDIEELVETEISFKSSLLEWAQKEKHEISFPVIGETGEKHQKQYIVAVEIDGEIKAEALDYSIKGAERLAAEKAWNQLSGNGNK